MTHGSPQDSRPAWPRRAAAPCDDGSDSSRPSAVAPERPRVGMRGSFHYDLRTGAIHITEGIARAFGHRPGWSPEDIESYFDAVHPDEREAYRAHFESLLVPEHQRPANARPVGEPSRQRVVWPDGTVVQLVCESAVETDDRGRPVAIVGSKRLARVLHDAGRAPNALRRAAADIAHDLRNLTQAMRSHLDVMRLEGEVEPSSTAALDGMLSRIDELGVELMNLEGRRPSSARWTELRRWLHGLEPLLADALGPDRSLDMSFPPLAVFGLVPTRRLEQALLHLVANAREATRPGARVRVSLAPRRDGEAFALSVADDGEGMDDEQLQRALQRGVSTRGRGRGLGLSIVRDLVRQLRGELHIDSELGRGTVVEMVLDAGERPAFDD